MINRASVPMWGIAGQSAGPPKWAGKKSYTRPLLLAQGGRWRGSRGCPATPIFWDYVLGPFSEFVQKRNKNRVQNK